MTSIDLYEDFNEEDDARFGDFDDHEDGNAVNRSNSGSDQENANNNGEYNEGKQEVDAGIKPTKPKRKLVTLNAERLKGPRGIIAIDDFFQNVKLKGKGYEKEDLNDVMKRLEHWCHRMFPKYHFDDALGKIERLGRKKEIALHMTRYRLGQLTQEDDNKVLSDNEENDERMEDSLAHELPVDEFEDMLNQQIALSNTGNRVMNNTTASNNTTIGNLNLSSVSTSTQMNHKTNLMFQQCQATTSISQDEIFSQLKQSSQPKPQLTDEQRARIEENRKKALAIRAAKLKELEEKRQKEQVEESASNQSNNIEVEDNENE